MKQKLSADQPIGIFDSGIGGLTVAHAIHQLLPGETLVYFGDTAHFPYGDKSEDSIRFYSIKIARFLLQQNCKMIVIACNTASSHAYNVVKEFVGDQVPVINVIDPVVEKVTQNKTISHVGVIGTKGTIKSNIYEKKIKKAKNSLQVTSLATPLLAPMIEEGFFDNTISKTIINSYLSKPKLRKIDSIILGCTHYPLIKKEINAIYNGKVKIVDSAEMVALHVKDVLKRKKILHSGKSRKHHFYVSDYTESFDKSASMFFHYKIKLEEANIWT